jgi:hypothetical protein
VLFHGSDTTTYFHTEAKNHGVVAAPIPFFQAALIGKANGLCGIEKIHNERSTKKLLGVW